MKLVIEERSVRSLYVSTGNPGWIQDSTPIPLPDSLRVRYRIYSLSAELMKFYIARKPTSGSRSLNL